MDEPISARYEWNEDGLVDSLEAHGKQASGTIGRFVLRALLILFAVVTAGIPLAMLLTPGDWEAKRGILIVMVVLFGYLWAMFYLALWSKGLKRRNARKAFGKLAAEARFVEWTFAEDQVSNQTALSASTYLWPLFHKVVEAPKGFLIYQNINFFHWIPGYAFASADAVRQFAELARAKVPQYSVVGECQYVGKPEPIVTDEF
jgi:uncharacterized integral membrane protein